MHGVACKSSACFVDLSPQGLSKYLRDQLPTVAKNGVVVGFDGRHNSYRYVNLVFSACFLIIIDICWHMFIKPYCTSTTAILLLLIHCT